MPCRNVGGCQEEERTLVGVLPPSACRYLYPVRPVILSKAKDLQSHYVRLFASFRVTIKD